MPITLTCGRCTKTYEYGKKCSCYYKSRKKDNAIKGLDDNFYSSTAWRTLREIKLNEYNSMCQRCLVKENKIVTTKLEAHHIVARSVNKSLELDPNNVVIVCKTCNLQLGTSGVDWDIESGSINENWGENLYTL